MTLLDYELLDYGHGSRYERFGDVRLIRPETFILERPNQDKITWVADSICHTLGNGRYEWEPVLLPWVIQYGSLKFELRQSQSKNIGIFPEQEANWYWLSQVVKPGQKVLNLFAYTGVATLVCAQAGAEVCHVDASKAAVRWASDNARLSGMGDASIRWIVEDARVFLKREQVRGNQYDGIILDPPAFGRTQRDDFKFERDIPRLLADCGQPSWLLLNSYAVNLKPRDLAKLVKDCFPRKQVDVGELKVRDLALSVVARFS